MLTNKSQKISQEFYCEKCNYLSSKKYDFDKHLQTAKHRNLHNTYKCDAHIKYKCNCGKIYKHRQSLHNHKKRCNGVENKNTIIDCENNKEVMKELVMQLIKQNNELQKTINDIIPNVGNNNNNITNNNNNKFNINVFLNEKCKDALSM